MKQLFANFYILDGRILEVVGTHRVFSYGMKLADIVKYAVEHNFDISEVGSLSENNGWFMLNTGSVVELKDRVMPRLLTKADFLMMRNHDFLPEDVVNHFWSH